MPGIARAVRRDDRARKPRSRRPASAPTTRRDAQLAWLFELFPILKERQGQMAQTLSGGEQQMLAIGRALMMQPQILILDEPTLGPRAGHPGAAVEGAGRSCARPPRSPCCSASRTSPSRCRMPTASTCSSMPGSSGRAIPDGSRARRAPDISSSSHAKSTTERKGDQHVTTSLCPRREQPRSPRRSRCALPRPPTRSRTIRSRSA